MTFRLFGSSTGLALIGVKLAFPPDPVPKYHLHGEFVAELSLPTPSSEANRVLVLHVCWEACCEVNHLRQHQTVAKSQGHFWNSHSSNFSERRVPIMENRKVSLLSRGCLLLFKSTENSVYSELGIQSENSILAKTIIASPLGYEYSAADETKTLLISVCHQF